jgi:hypothetical protein
MTIKLNYAKPAATRPSTRQMLFDGAAGSIQVLGGLFYTVVLAIFLDRSGSSVDALFERPRQMVRQGIARIGGGKEGASNCRL